MRLYLAHLKVAHQNDVQLLSGVIKRNYARFAKIVRMLRNRKDIRLITDKVIDFKCKYYTLFMSIHDICVHLSMSTNIGMFLCNITEHVKYISEVRSFLVGLILFLLSCLLLCGSKLPVILLIMLGIKIAVGKWFPSHSPVSTFFSVLVEPILNDYV